MLSSIIGACAVRISRLTSDGTPDYDNANGSVLLVGGISSFEHDFDIEEGDDLVEKDACGNLVVVRKYPDRVKRATFTLTLAKKDYRIDEILGVAQLVEDAGDPVGMAVQAAAGCEPGSQGNGVVIELWSEQFDCADFVADAPYQRAVLPRAFLVPAGFSRESGVALPVFNGFAQPNGNFDDGPWGDLDVMAASGIDNWVYAELDDDDVAGGVSMPDPFDYLPLPSSAS